MEEKTEKTLYLMLHGQTLFNVRRKVQGVCDSPLTQLGIDQAIVSHRYFDDNKIMFDHAYSSTSERASDTPELITEMPYKRLKGLKELNFGLFEGENEDLNPKLSYGEFFVQFGDEAEMEMRHRVADTLLDIMLNEDHQVVLTVSHGASCRQFMRYWAHTSELDQKERIGNCFILKFEFENDEF